MRTLHTTNLSHLLDPEHAAEPYSFYAEARTKSPVQWDEWMQTWAVFGHPEILDLSKDRRLSVARIPDFYESLPEQARGDVALLARTLSDMMLFNDPPHHTRLRRLIRPSLSPRLAREMRFHVQELAEELLDKVLPSGRMDIIHDFSEPLSRGVIAKLAGVSGDATHLLESWQGLLHEFFTQSDSQNARIEALRESFDRTATARRNGTADDFFSRMISPQLRAADYTEDEVFANLLLLIDAGQATTTHLIGNAVLALLNNDEQTQRLRRDPELMTPATNELMRYDSSVQFTTRKALADIELGEHLIRAGQSVTLVLGSGNRDPRRYTDPDILDVSRPAADHLSFGHGIHYCLGASLALTEIDVALRALLRRTTNWKCEVAQPEWLESLNFRFLASLPITFEAIA
ncbi:cytochrome P450 [Streptomyces neyagawaensis]|uniref:cytochrome P450 n=1 Tax=Streptomyces neyagawaensis TaxID=42238 RepID=UPI0012FE8BED|nr:cytochrome P450 [Streptomyces neyagawaensis]MCL6733995.1 cytochrome P450 [Streptomyces neyagawaensis]MDE1682846.1 cytochrome P450 [Streptomyces neyagawaensis]